MVEFEADDALAAGAALFKNSDGVEQVVICSPDKDLAQSVSGKRVVLWDRRREIILDEEEVIKKFGVRPESIPDWLALVGDVADGYPGIEGWGAKSAAAVLYRFGHLEKIPLNASTWGVKVARASHIARTLEKHRDEAMLYRQLATLRLDVPLKETLEALKWKGAREGLKRLCSELGEEDLPARIPLWRAM